MEVNKNTNSPERKQDFVYVAVLLAIALVIGVYLIATTVLIDAIKISIIISTKQLEIYSSFLARLSLLTQIHQMSSSD